VSGGAFAKWRVRVRGFFDHKKQGLSASLRRAICDFSAGAYRPLVIKGLPIGRAKSEGAAAYRVRNAGFGLGLCWDVCVTGGVFDVGSLRGALQRSLDLARPRSEPERTLINAFVAVICGRSACRGGRGMVDIGGAKMRACSGPFWKGPIFQKTYYVPCVRVSMRHGWWLVMRCVAGPLGRGGCHRSRAGRAVGRPAVAVGAITAVGIARR